MAALPFCACFNNVARRLASQRIAANALDHVGGIKGITVRTTDGDSHANFEGWGPGPRPRCRDELLVRYGLLLEGRSAEILIVIHRGGLHRHAPCGVSGFPSS